MRIVNREFDRRKIKRESHPFCRRRSGANRGVRLSHQILENTVTGVPENIVLQDVTESTELQSIQIDTYVGFYGDCHANHRFAEKPHLHSDLVHECRVETAHIHLLQVEIDDIDIALGSLVFDVQSPELDSQRIRLFRCCRYRNDELQRLNGNGQQVRSSRTGGVLLRHLRHKM